MRVTDVHKAYGRHQVLRGAGLELPAGCLAGIVGENGSGKTTLLRILAGQLRPDRGTVECPGPVGYCPQETVLNPAFTVDQHLELFRVAYRLAGPGRAHELLDMLRFTAYRHHRIGTLSGGTQQKLNLVLALMHDPPLLLLDEPYQGFDWEAYQRFWELAAALREAGRSFLVVSHIAYDTGRFDRLWRLEGGRLVREGRSAHGPAAEG
ncbi:ABC transporter ATP-binding protein [Streptomyces sp. AV19]|uniref:ABC transporter ATP-binding protein n=1 Tax=Streptomyces sp. AV19 TaxID=2793068 RepID=UPI0018FE8880|nr:ABC transporter ATP-binding protein [Streptomyces sp. AV19]MBH1937370.1 ABC transporter ATP-binding protein [Streptomyces sp. AV19]MDG4533900.1 ABC transporter ATP-binding protein [Streptomyces sp. AV19]